MEKRIDVCQQYDRVAGLYDLLFSFILDPGRKEVIRQINALPPSRILEIGVGTGLRLEQYDARHRIIGVDISEKMIEKAQARKARLGLHNLELMRMDAQQLTFPDDSFDIVVAQYVVSTVEDPQKLMSELERVCRPSGKIFILNHFSEKFAAIERWLLPLTRRLGWNSYFDRGQIQMPGLRLIREQPINAFGYWQLLEYRRAS